MKKIVKNILIGAGLTVSGTIAVTVSSFILTKKLVGIAMDRKTPKIVEKSRLNVTRNKNMADFVVKMDEAEEKLQNSGCETVEILSHDGLKLIGHYHKCKNAERIILAMHGWRSSWAKDFGIISDFWNKNNCSVLYAEQRAHGNSEGFYMSFGMNERYDCFSWIKWINEVTGASFPIYLAGVSMGATTVLMTAGMELPENVKGVVADCAFTSPHEIWKYVVQDKLHIPYDKARSKYADKLSRKKSGFGTNEYSTIDAMKVCKIPVLFVHGTSDRLVPIEMTYKNYLACSAAKKLLVVPGAEHGMSYIVNSEIYEEAVIDFWKENDI